MTNLLETIEINPPENPKFSVIWLHGLGADGHDFEAIASQLRLPTTLGVRFVFPHAPVIPVTINNGAMMRAWYDIPQLNFIKQEDEAGIRRSEQQLVQLIANEASQHGILPNRIILAGFSQGGAIALHTGLRYAQSLLGVMALSTYLPLSSLFPEQTHMANQSVPILMMHGRHDSVVPLNLAEKSKALLQRYDYAVQWQTYNMPHSVLPEQIADISGWMREIMLKADSKS